MAPTAPSAKKTPRAIASAKKKVGPTDNSSIKIKDIGPDELCSSTAPLHEKASYNQLSRSRTYLKASCAFPEDDFILLHSQLKDDLDQPSNLVGLVGPQKGKEFFETWLVDYMNAGIGATYWSTDKGRIWDYSTDEGRENIRIFLRVLVKFTGSELRKKRRRSSNIEKTTTGTSQKTLLPSAEPAGPNDGEDIAQEAVIQKEQQNETYVPGTSSATLKKASSAQSIWNDDPLEKNAGNITDIDSSDCVADYGYGERPYIF